MDFAFAIAVFTIGAVLVSIGLVGETCGCQRIGRRR
jgi:hypothetical protein